jgi:hypothetical protein
MKLIQRFAALVALVLVAAVPAFAQTTASLTGTVTSEGNALPGATVTITSPNLQGTRSTVSGEAGGYQFSALPPGDYTVTFELSGMEKVVRKAQLQLSQTARADANLRVSGMTEAITVTASSPTVLETPQVATNLTLRQVESLPVARNQVATALLAPGVNGNTLSASQFQISGSPGYDNLVLVNGVVVTENVRSQARPLYVEDAIQETTVLTGSISAEYGRFTGGVVNTITKSGGNEFSGSLRDSFTNAAWSAQTPSLENRISKLNQTYEGTLGGYVLRDRLWFFGSGRMAKTDSGAQTFAVPANPPVQPAAGPLTSFSIGSDEKRYEIKLTGQITPKHNLVASYFDVKSESTNTRFQAAVYDLASLNDRSDPESLLSVHYNGVLTSNLLVEGQYSKREQAFVGSGSKFTDLVKGTLLIDRTNNARFNSPTFCGVCDTETRNNGGYILKANYFHNTRALGSHNVVAGLDRFEEQRYANNFQSGSNFRIFVNSVRTDGSTLFPVVTPTSATGGNTYIRWTPIFVDANESNLRTDSLFVNDKWDFNSHWSFNLGFRYDKNDAVDGVGNVSSKDSKFSPRLGAFYDIKGDGRHRVSASYGEYVSRIVEGIAASNNTAGNPGTIDFSYQGPSFNTTGNTTPLPDVIAAIFAYFNGTQGGTSNTAAGNLRPTGARAVPGYSAYFDGDVVSPNVRELTVGYGLQIGQTGFAKVDLISRDWKDFYVSSRTLQTQRVTSPLGIPVDLSLIQNSSNIKREYRGAQFQARWNPKRFQTGMNYTYATLKGNDEGETAGSGPVANIDPATRYPEFLNYDRYIPVGYLSGDQRHKVRAWLGYDVPLPSVAGRLNVSLLQNYDSGVPYSAVGTINATSYAGAPANPGYNSLPGGQYYFSDRGEFRTDNISSTNLAVRYAFPFAGAEIFLQGDLLNAFNEDGVTGVGTGVSTNSNTSALLSFNPFTGSPVQCPTFNASGGVIPVAQCQTVAPGSNYQLASTFGKPTSNASYQTPRTYRFSAGFRF